MIKKFIDDNTHICDFLLPLLIGVPAKGRGGGEEGGWKGPGIFQAKCLYFRQKHLEKTKKILVCKKGTTLQSPKVLMPMYSSSTGKATLISLVLFYVDH